MDEDTRLCRVDHGADDGRRDGHHPGAGVTRHVEPLQYVNRTQRDAVVDDGPGDPAQTIGSVVLAVAIWRARFADRAVGWAFKLGLTISILGASSGSLMTAPTAAQLETMRAGERPIAIGAHTVGAADGGPGLAGTGWSTEHGDLRVPHFLGLHGFQALPLLALAARRRGWSERQNVRVIIAAAASYVLLFAVLLAGALRGDSIARPDGTTLLTLTAWALVSGTAVWFALAAHSRQTTPAH